MYSIVFTFLSLAIYLLHTIFLKGLFTYLRIKKSVGATNIAIIYKPLTTLVQFYDENCKKYGDSLYLHRQICKKNP
jgi:membrane-bound acyltransferase YfiQ involved in biofilm formation